MNEQEAEAFLIWRGWDRTPLSGRECHCSPPSWDSPTGEICAPCEARADEQAEAEWWEALEAERDAAFEALVMPVCSACGDRGGYGYECCGMLRPDARGEPICCGQPSRAACPECGAP